MILCLAAACFRPGGGGQDKPIREQLKLFMMYDEVIFKFYVFSSGQITGKDSFVHLFTNYVIFKTLHMFTM